MSQPNLAILTLFESRKEKGILIDRHYRDNILNALKKVLPNDFFDQKDDADNLYKRQHQIFQQLIPRITCSDRGVLPGCLSFLALFKKTTGSFKFFFEMIKRWLLPGKKLNIVLVYASDFRLSDLNHDVYTICEIMVSLDSVKDFEEIQRRFPLLGAEIALGIQSELYAQRILENKGLSTDDKTSSLQGLITYLVNRFPQVYGTDIFAEMQHMLVTCPDHFKAARQVRHLSKIISIQYVFRNSLREMIKKNPQRRHLNLKIFQAWVRTPGGLKRVLSLLTGINLLRDQETFGEKHLLRAIQQVIPSVQAIDQSFFLYRLEMENTCMSYIEIEKKDQRDFTPAEIGKLRRELPNYLKSCIEQKLHPIFMPRNEEEVMRNMLILTDQIKYLRDIPQVLITFDEQAYSHLYFTVILARILKQDSPSLDELFKSTETLVEYISDRTKIMGHMRKKYAKEASVFRLKILKDNFLRADQSIDLYKARQAILEELSRIVGEVRDYNGGMISKQHELLSAIRRLLTDVKDYDELLLENFFYSVSPVIVRALLDPRAFRTLFLMLLEGIRDYKQEGYYLKTYIEPYNTFVLVLAEDTHLKDLLNRSVQDLHIPTTELAYAYVKTHGNACIGYICCAQDAHKREALCQAIEHVLHLWEQTRPKHLTI